MVISMITLGISIFMLTAVLAAGGFIVLCMMAGEN